MDGITIQKRIYAGRAKAALRIGLACSLYRPISVASPLGNFITTMNAAFNAGDSTYRRPNLYDDPIWYADLDGSLTRPGDYLVRVSDSATWFVAAQQQLLPIVCIDCNRSVRITRQKPLTAVGAVGYGGMAPANEVDVLGGAGVLWPASILSGVKKEAGAGLPAGVSNIAWKILLPPSVAVILSAGDIATDDLGRRYAIFGAELTDLGWRMNAYEVHS